jgi:hypothetical protein
LRHPSPRVAPDAAVSLTPTSALAPAAPDFFAKSGKNNFRISDEEKNIMKSHISIQLTMLALAMTTLPAPAQSNINSAEHFNFPQLPGIWQPGQSRKTSKAPLDRGHDPLALGLAKAKVYRFASADYPGAAVSMVFDRNTSTILGYTIVTDATGFTLVSGNYSLWLFPNSLDNNPYGINTSGEIVGTYTDLTGAMQGFLNATTGDLTITEPLAAANTTVPYDVNDSGEVVGYYQDTFGLIHGFYTSDYVNFASFDFPGATSTWAYAVNTAGEIVGQWKDSSGVFHGFLLNGSSYNSFDFPLSASTTASGINDSGEIAGTFLDAAGNQHGFIYSRNAYSQIDIAGAPTTDVIRIKNNGNIVGLYLDVTSNYHGFTGH